MIGFESGGVPETMLWTLYHRAAEAGRPDTVLPDPKAVELVDRIEFPFAERFGDTRLAQWQALRVRVFDREVRRFIAGHPGGTVVALGEGLETQFWRVDDGRVQWLTVDLPESLAVREQVLPATTDRQRAWAGSALDVDRWADAVDPARGVLVTAQGLLMYLERDGVHGLITRAAQRFPAAAAVFDLVSRVVSERSGQRATPQGYQPPKWTYGADAAERAALAALPGVASLELLRLPRGRGALHGFLLPLAVRLPGLRTALWSSWRADLR